MGYMYDILEKQDTDIETINNDLEVILRSIPSYIDIMLSQTMALSQAYKMGRSPKKITAKNIMTQIQFSQNLMQGGWINKDAFGQLPGFDDEATCKKAKTLLGGQSKTIYNYCTQTEAQRKAWAPEIFGNGWEHKFSEQEKCISALPIVKLTMEAFVDGEDDIVVGDILTCKLKVEYLNLEKGQKSGYVHSKHYPYLKR